MSMKPINKKVAKIFIALIVIALVVGSVFAFVPMRFNNVTFTSLVSSINKSTDLGGGVYAEYELDKEYSAEEINSTISTIRGILDGKGYTGANIYSIEDQKIRVEIGDKGKYNSLKESNVLLSSIGIGAFELRSSSSADDTYIVGNKHVKGAKVNTYNSTIYALLEFNQEGVKRYEEMLKASKTIYVYMGGNLMTSFSSENIEASSQMPLTFQTYESAQDFCMKVKLGSMDAQFKNGTAHINTMSSTLSHKNHEVNPYNKHFATSSALIAGIVAIVLVAVLGIAFIIWKYGMMGVFELLALVFDTIIAVFFIWAFPWLELSLSSLIAIALGFAIVLSTSLIYISRVEEEFKQGKTVSASLESGYKKSLSPVLATGIVLTLIFGVVAIAANAELKVFGLITLIFSCISMFNSAIMLPGFVNIFEAFNDGASKPYRLANEESDKNEK